MFAVKRNACVCSVPKSPITRCFECSLRERIANYRYWPVEVFRTAAAAAGGAKKGRVS